MELIDLKKIINTVLENNGRDKINELSENTRLQEDLGLESLDLAELTVRIESEYGVDVFESGIVTTIGEIKNKIEKNG